MKFFFTAVVFIAAAALSYMVLVVIHREKILGKMKGEGDISFVKGLKIIFYYLKGAAIKANAPLVKNKFYDRVDLYAKKLGAGAEITREYFLLVQEVLFFIFFFLGFWAAGGAVFPLAAAAAGFVLPAAVLKSKSEKKQENIIKELPDALDIMAASIEGGLSINRALALYADKNNNDFAVELRSTIKSVQLGKSFEDAMESLAEKFGIGELTAFVNSFIQAEKSGGNIKNIIKAQADELRKKRFQRLKKRAHEAPVKLLIPLVIFIFPVVFIVLFGPIIIRLMQGF